jgi:hypothetical protein
MLTDPDWAWSPKPKPNTNAKTIKIMNATKPRMSSIGLCMAIATGLAAAVVSSHAQSGTATISGGAAGSSFDYTRTLENTGTNALNSFWFGWTTSGDNLPSAPSSSANSLAWSNDLSGNSIKWTNSSGTALAPGASGWTYQDTFSAATPALQLAGRILRAIKNRPF